MARLHLGSGLQFPDGSTQDSAGITLLPDPLIVGWRYQVDLGSTDLTLTSGATILFNNATPASSTHIGIGNGTTNGAGDPNAVFGYLGAYSGATKCFLRITDVENLDEWQVWKVTAITSGVGGFYYDFTVVGIDHQGSLNDNADVLLEVYLIPDVSSGSGDVVGPSSSVDNELVLFNSTTGKLIKRASSSGIVKLASGVIGTSTPLGQIDGLTPSDDDFLQRKASAWANRTIAQVKTDLAINNVDNTSNASERAATATLTNKRVTPRTGTTASSATPTINTDNVDFYSITALAANITSMTTNLSGTPTTDQKLHIAITGTASRSIAWGASFESSTALLPTTTIGTARLDILLVWTGSIWRCLAVA